MDRLAIDGGSYKSPAWRRFHISFRRTRWIADEVCFFFFLSLVSTGSSFSAEIVDIRTLARAERGCLALVPFEAMAGDPIAICQGGSNPLVLRGDGPEKMRLVGDCHVHGMMNGGQYCEEDCHAIRIY